MADDQRGRAVTRFHDDSVRRGRIHASFGSEFHQGDLEHARGADEDMLSARRATFKTSSRGVAKCVWELTEKDGYVFPAIRSLSKPLSEVAMNSALRRLG